MINDPHPIIVDCMAIHCEEAKMLKEQSTLLRMKAFSQAERCEMLVEKYN